MKPVLWKDNKVHMVDQRRLPTEEIWLTYETAEAVADAIKTMVVRGAPAIGVSAAYGLALEALTFEGTRDSLIQTLEAKAAILEATRPTAINLKWALDRMLRFARTSTHADVKELCSALVEEAKEIHAEDIRLCKAIGDAGATLIPQGARVLTHCNAGGLATSSYGTALAVMYGAGVAPYWYYGTAGFDSSSFSSGIASLSTAAASSSSTSGGSSGGGSAGGGGGGGGGGGV